jgi:hypothetical protein
MTTPPTYQVGQPNPVGMELQVYIQFFNWASSLAGVVRSPVVSLLPRSVVGRERRTSRYLLAASLLYCDFPPGIHLNGRPPSPSPTFSPLLNIIIKRQIPLRLTSPTAVPRPPHSAYSSTISHCWAVHRRGGQIREETHDGASASCRRPPPCFPRV